LKNKKTGRNKNKISTFENNLRIRKIERKVKFKMAKKKKKAAKKKKRG
jgi:hypothetical protein